MTYTMITDIMLIFAAVINLFFGFIVIFASQSKLKIKLSFAVIAFSSALWTFFIVLFRYVDALEQIQIILRFLYITPIMIPLAFVYFVGEFCKDVVAYQYHKLFRKIFIVYALLLTFLIVFTNFIVIGAKIFLNEENHVYFGPIFILYIIYHIITFFWGYWILFNQYRKAKAIRVKQQALFLLIATVTGSMVGLIGNLILPWCGIFVFNWTGNLFTVFFVGFIFYAIVRHKLFDIKVFTAEIMTLVIWFILFLRLLFSNNFIDLLVNSFLFCAVLISGIFLILSVKKEVENREKGERLARYLANANARLRELDQQKTEFVSIASHQLRSPIAAIKGYASMMSEGAYGKISKQLQEPLSRILESGQRIAIMVDDFLNVTRIEQGRMTYDMKPHNVFNILNDVINELKIVAKDKKINLKINKKSSKKVYVKADEGKIKQIFSNLIDNAIKYTHKGAVDVLIEPLKEKKKVLIKIKDTGIGIASEEIDGLFQKFNRASNANDENVLGTGLGLYIAREIIKAHDGWINVESEGIGKGSTFTIELPAFENKKINK